MFNTLSALIGWRFFRDRQTNRAIRFISIASMTGILLGVAVLIVVLSVMNGFEREFKTRFLNITAHAQLRAYEDVIRDWRQIIEQAQDLDGIASATPEVTLQVLTRDGLKFKGIELIGLDTQYENQISAIHNAMSDEAWQSLQAGKEGLVLGAGLAKELSVKVGDSMMLYLPQVQHSLSAPPRMQRFVITGIFNFHGQIDYTRAYISRVQASQLLGFDDAVTQIKIRVDDIFQAPYLIRKLGNQVEQYVYMSDWTHEDHYQDIQLVRFIMYVVLFLVIAVACFNIVSTLVMSVRQKRSEIAILATMGLSRSAILQTFMIQGTVNGFLGVVLGTFFGCLVAVNLTPIVHGLEGFLGIQLLSPDIYFVDFLPSELHYGEVIFVACMASLMCIVATVYPAYKASQIAPAQALSHLT
tara:strand:- start:8661 stop:9899 length:1239 start_codon:yes stop_codon:yes gene_type:complete